MYESIIWPASFSCVYLVICNFLDLKKKKKKIKFVVALNYEGGLKNEAWPESITYHPSGMSAIGLT